MGRASRRRQFLCAAAVIATTLMTGAGAPAARPVLLDHNTSGGGDRLDVVLKVTTAAPQSRCTGVLRLRGKRRELPKIHTGDEVAAQWRWEVARGAPAGRLRVRITCRVNGRLSRASRAFHVRAGRRSSRGFRRIVAVGTMHTAQAEATQTRKGSGNVGGNLYPPGQCTYFVAQLRPDLPFFPGAGGDAKNWARSAKAAGWVVNATPAVGAVAVFKPGQYGAGVYGHVAVVQHVSDRYMTIQEANYGRRPTGTPRRIAWRGLRFIHGRIGDGSGPPPSALTVTPGGPGSGSPPASTQPPPSPLAASPPRPAPVAEERELLLIDNRVTEGMAMREDPSPVRLTTAPRVYCGARGCAITGTERGSGETYVGAVCWLHGENTTNGDRGNPDDDRNPELYESTRYYGVRLDDGTFGYVSEVWVADGYRGGLGLPQC